MGLLEDILDKQLNIDYNDPNTYKMNNNYMWLIIIIIVVIIIFLYIKNKDKEDKKY
jgi:hypothetical protein